MALTFANQQSLLSRLLGDANTGSDDMWPLADRKTEINRGELQFARDSKLLLGYATGTVSSQTISIPSDWIETYVLVVNNKTFSNDREISLHDYERYINSGGDHYYYWVNASNTRLLNFINTNQDSQTYKLWYFRKPSSDLSGDTDESPFPDEYREASVYYAASILLEQIGKTQMSDRHRAKYEYFVAKGQNESERLYINKQYARPDIKDSNEFDADVQGIGQVN